MTITLPAWSLPPEPETTRTLDPFYVGALVRRQFLSGVQSCCIRADVDWEWEAPRRNWLTGKIFITVWGPASQVDEATTRIRTWVEGNLGIMGLPS